jgi:hypothetical protein
MEDARFGIEEKEIQAMRMRSFQIDPFFIFSGMNIAQ